MPKALHLIGQVFTRLTVLSRAANNKHKKTMWNCRCSCGTTLDHPVAGNNLRSGCSKSCGCLDRDLAGQRGALRLTTHGHRRGGKPSPTASSWDHMIQRCTDRYDDSYYRYGGANPPVTVCDRWRTFENFLADMGERPEGTTLSRFGDVGDYEPLNCAWHTWAQQRAEPRTKKLVTLATAA
jgi:hypothetical protein